MTRTENIFGCRKWTLFGVALVSFVGVVGQVANAVELVPPGTHAKVGSGAGQTLSRGSTALFFNPANLIYGKFIEPFVDVSFVNANYTYTHTSTEFEPVTVPVQSPAASAGLSIRPLPWVAIGVAVLPTGGGGVTRVESVPIELIPGTPQIFDVESEDESYRLAAGAAVRFGYVFSLGAGAIRTRERGGFRLFDPKNGDEADAVVDAQFESTGYQYVVGVRSELFDRALVIGGSFRTGVIKEYLGDIIHPQSQGEFVAYEGLGYLPRIFALGLEVRFGSVGLFLDGAYEMWSLGRTIVRRGLPTDPFEVDLLDAFAAVAGLKYWIAKKHQILLSGGYYSANVGDGLDEPEAAGLQSSLQEVVEDDGRIGGVDFGNINAVPRLVVSAGYRAKITGNGYFQGGVQYQKGNRVVPETFPGEGFYEVSILIATLGLAFGF